MKAPSVRVVVAAVVFTACLSACESSPRPAPLYAWGSYETQVYAYLKGESRDAQLLALEQDRKTIEAGGYVPPPGFYAHMGLLYAETGNNAMAAACFQAEKTRFPEASAYMDFLLAGYEQ